MRPLLCRILVASLVLSGATPQQEPAFHPPVPSVAPAFSTQALGVLSLFVNQRPMSGKSGKDSYFVKPFANVASLFHKLFLPDYTLVLIRDLPLFERAKALKAVRRIRMAAYAQEGYLGTPWVQFLANVFPDLWVSDYFPKQSDAYGEFDNLPQTDTYLLRRNGRDIATIAITRDLGAPPDHLGLSVEKDFPGPVQDMRKVAEDYSTEQIAWHVGAVSGFATVRGYRNKRTVDMLTGAVEKNIESRHIGLLLAGVHPKHLLFYKIAFKIPFRKLAKSETASGLKNAEQVLIVANRIPSAPVLGEEITRKDFPAKETKSRRPSIWVPIPQFLLHFLRNMVVSSLLLNQYAFHHQRFHHRDAYEASAA